MSNSPLVPHLRNFTWLILLNSLFSIPTDLLSVSDLTYRIKEILEYDADLQEIHVQGEISNCTIHGSGHAYFTLKDEESQLSCVMFKRFVEGCDKGTLRHGTKVIVQGSVTVYPQRGSYQLMVTGLKAAGDGLLYQQFVRLKEKLEREGLFDVSRKKPLPSFPGTIGVVTSPTGAVIRDILQTLQRRFPCGKVILSPSLVQGDVAAASVIQALQALIGTPEIEVIIIARGGGSAEDLWCFNDEGLARAVYSCPIPVISAIGHETDFTILDFVADVRAATPTAAAELVAPDQQEILASLQSTRQQLLMHLQYRLFNHLQVLDDATERIRMQKQLLLERKKSELSLLEAQLRQHDPRTFLEKGFSLTMKDGKLLRSVGEAAPGDTIETILADGRLTSVVQPSK